ncbi:MAG: PEP-CTERM sorting domain-containing protein [Bryobacterales bacterium]|nr:PEP-CTERM sorting domain-containing protein [Bryobacterales bacterium]
MFDLIVSNPLTITSFDVNLANGLEKEIFVYYKSGTYAGFELNSAAWTLLGSATVTSAGSDVPTALPVGGLFLTAGTYGLFVTTDGSTASAIRYTNGATSTSDGNLEITAGVGTAVPFVDAPITDRIWNGTIYYNVGSDVPEPATWSMGVAALLAGVVLRRRRI